MAFDVTGRRLASVAAILLVAAGLSACTTTEGTNAFTDVATFEREVMTSTAQGLGLVPREEKADPTNPRGPLVLPKSGQALPAPTQSTAAAQLPEDSGAVKYDVTGLTAADIERVKRTRVVSVSTPDGRPLTAAELKTLTERVKDFRITQKRSIYTPSEQYFSVSTNQQDLVCLTARGELVSVNDASCPAEIRQALLKRS